MAWPWLSCAAACNVGHCSPGEGGSTGGRWLAVITAIGAQTTNAAIGIRETLFIVPPYAFDVV
jgi:hypothetical protein